MNEPSSKRTIPADDEQGQLVHVRADDADLRHVAVVGDSYTILVSGADTNGRFAVIDMLIPAGEGPPPHRHTFEEMFHVLEGDIEVTCRGITTVARTGDIVSIPANAPHTFRNISDRSTRLLCTVAPAGLDEFFLRVGQPIPNRTAPAPKLDIDGMAAFIARADQYAAGYGIENLPTS